MPPEEFPVEAEDHAAILLEATAALLAVAEGDEPDPAGAMRTPLLMLLRSVRLLEEDDGYDGSRHAGIVADLETVDAAVLASDAYTDAQKDAARRLLLAAYNAVSGSVEVTRRVARRIQVRQVEVQQEWGRRLREGLVIIDDDERMHDVALSAFLAGGYFVEDHFDLYTDPVTNRELLEGVCATEPWGEAFGRPQNLARALHRRGWLTDAQLAALLDGWDERL